MIEVLSPAKINLFLHITGRRPDGYHTLQTVFQLLDWGDTMRFSPRAEPGVVLKHPMPGVAESNNLILRAAALLLESYGGSESGAVIDIEKRLPMGGGLGGGSSNAATTLIALNTLWNLGASVSELAEIGLRLGADVPVFVRGYSAWAEGLGEILTPLTLPPRWFVVAIPKAEVQTAEIFRHPGLTRNTKPITMSALFAGQVRNDLEPVVVEHYSAVRNALNWLSNSAPAMMTGSGACVFAGFDSEDTARTVALDAPQDLRTVVVRGINESPVLRI
ncbi:4-(cytidine 5'-diphospho)-2-C-methyl-D-erythritol kinase [Luminiphilus syltensis NOR5-1B]|uniref:4-diphosphocytidyl-2-C-methyl-D-erythritol kinase n=1 Tax=Luminiphilus syltensis NOR5-1B TaxID=565045 RepID=B8KRB0_9GAMM|nr:4-(cytidine 5'-diphospho)-2-C-methyl-D-erythritol kinase [Luminiphilus syltensis NOR5-1B]